MADLIELDLVVRDKGLKQSLTTVERLERQIVKAAKAVDQNRISQDRYNKILLQAKREYQALGVSSQKATSNIRRFAEANREAARSAVANGDALGFAGKKINRMGVGLQQAGYQVGDFAVQIQGGTNAAVALGQQGAQLLGIFGPAGAIAGAALAITTAFIAPLLKAKDSVKELEDETIKSIENIDKRLKATRLGVSEEEISFIDKLAVAQEKYNSALENFNSERAFLAGGEFSAKEMEELLLGDKEAMEQARVEASAASAAYEQFKASRTALLAGASLEAFGGEGDLTFSPEGLAIAEEYSDYLVKIRGLMGEVSSETTTVTQKTVDLTSELGGSVEEAIALQKALDSGKISASQLSGVDIKAGISPAVAAAQELAKQLGVSLRTALAMSGMIKKAGPVLDPRDPAYDADAANLQRLKDMVESGELYNSTLEKVTKSTKKVGSTTKDTMTEAEKALEEAQEAAQAYADALDNTVVSAVGSVSDAWADFVMRGFKDFKGFVGSVLDSFKNMIAQMIAMAAKNRIMLALGIGGVAPTAAMAGSGMLGGAGILGGGGAGIGAAMSGVGSGIAGIMSGGGLGASFANLGGLMSGSVGGLGAIGAAIPAVAAIAVVVGLFSKKVKELDSGLRVTIDNTDTLVESYRKLETSRLFGLIKKRSTQFEEAEGETAAPITKAVADVQASVVDMASALGIGSDAFSDFSYQFQVSLKGLSEEEALAAIQKEFVGVADAMADLVPNLMDFAREGETSSQVLKRLSDDLLLVNNVFKQLGRSAESMSTQAAAAASRLVSAAGGQSAFVSKTQTLVGSYLDPTEQLSYYQRQLEGVFEGGLPSKSQVKGIIQEGSLEELETLYGGDTIQTLGTIFQLQDQIAAEEKARKEEAQRRAAAAAAASARAAKEAREAAKKEQQRILGERLGLEEELLQLQGNTAELRRRELEALDPTNRALQEMIWKLQDAKEVMDGISESDFATLFDYQKAVAMSRVNTVANNPQPVSPMPAIVNGSPTVSADSMPSGSSEGSTLENNTFVRQSLVEIIKYSKRTSDTLRKFDNDGLPPERT